MADRQVRVIIAADVAQAIRSFKEVETGLKKVGDTGEDTTSKGAKSAGVLSQAWANVGNTAKLAATGGILLAGKAVISAGMDFEKSLNMMQAVSGATGDQMAKVSELAKQLGSDVMIPGASASDAAAGMTELAKGGLSVAEAMKAARGTLQLATAAQVDGATAAQIQANALNAFSLKGDQASHVADVLANVSNAASGELTDFAAGLQQSAGVAQQFGINLDDTVTVLGLFAKNGMAGSDAGTSLKTALIALASPSKQQSIALEELGVKVYDAQGKFVGLRVLTEQLATASKAMTQEQFNQATATAFGSDAMRAAGFLAKEGVVGYDAMSEAVKRNGGAQELAAAQAQGMNGAWNNLTNTLETAALKVYDTVQPALVAITDAGSFLVGVLGEIPGPVYAGIAAFTAFKLLDGPVTAFLSNVHTKMASITAQAPTMGAKVGAAGKSLLGAFGGPWGLAITAGVTALGFFAGSSDKAAESTADFSGAIDENTGALKENAAEVIAKALADSDSFKLAKDAGISIETYTRAVMGETAAIDELNRKHAEMKEASLAAQAANREAAAAAGNYGNATVIAAQNVLPMNLAMERLANDSANFAGVQTNTNDAITAAGAIMGGAAPKAATFADAVGFMVKQSEGAPGPLGSVEDAMKAMGDQTKQAKDQLGYFTAAIDGLAGRTPDLSEAQKNLNDQVRGLAAGFKDVTEATDFNKKTLIDSTGAINTTTEAGSRLYDQLESYRAAADASTNATFRNALETKGLSGAMADARFVADAARESFIKKAGALGLNAEQAAAAADQLGIIKGIDIPDKTFEVIAGTTKAEDAIRALDAQIEAIPDFITKQLTINAVANIRSGGVPMRFNGATGQLEPAQENGGVVHAEIGRMVTGRGSSGAAIGSGAGLTWAERATGKEYYLSMKPGMAGRNRGLASDAVAELGGRVDWNSQQYVSSSTNAVSTARMEAQLAQLIGVAGGPRVGDINITTGDPDVGPAINRALFRLGAS